MTQSLAIVTGAAGDIGRAIARKLADDHDVVLLVDIDAEAAEKAARALGDGKRFVAVACDVTNAESVAAMAAKAAEKGAVRTSSTMLVLPVPSACTTRRRRSGAWTMR